MVILDECIKLTGLYCCQAILDGRRAFTGLYYGMIGLMLQ